MQPLIVASVGNSRTKLGIFRGKDLDSFEAHFNTDIAGIVARLSELTKEGVSVALASVNDRVADAVQSGVEAASGTEVLRVGRDFPVPIAIALDDVSTIGQDRLLNAIGAFSKISQACIVIDCGTATTVDFVDGQGTFQGGAIAPGVRVNLKALHDQIPALPLVDFSVPDVARGPLGKDTRHAMTLGALASVRGLVHYLIDRYAEYYEAYPTVIATGGDAALLFENDELVEKIIPSLQLIGIHEAFIKAAEGDIEAPDRDEDDERDERDENED